MPDRAPEPKEAPRLRSCSKSRVLPEPIGAQKTAIRLADNYVIFRREGDGTFVADCPPTVATAEENGAHEVWHENDPFAVQLRTLLFAGSPRGWLRSTHRQISHPHIRVKDVDTVSLTQQLLDLCSRFGIASRDGSRPRLRLMRVDAAIDVARTSPLSPTLAAEPSSDARRETPAVPE